VRCRLRSRIGAFVVATGCALAAVALAQSTSGRLTGSVRSADGAPVARARVTATKQDDGTTRTATTSADGVFAFPQMRTGRYTVKASTPELAEQAIRDVEVTIGETVSMPPIVLRPTSVRAAGVPRAEVEVRQLDPGAETAGALTGGQYHLYRIELQAGQYVGVTVDHPGVPLVARVFEPGRRRVVSAQSPAFGGARFEVSLIAPVAASYALEVRSLGEGQEAKSYSLRVTVPRVASERDRLLVAARLDCASGVGYRAQNSSDALRRAADRYGRALDAWRILGDREAEEFVLTELGEVYEQLGDGDAARGFFEQARRVRSSR
jgi:hypothetical protein